MYYVGILSLLHIQWFGFRRYNLSVRHAVKYFTIGSIFGGRGFVPTRLNIIYLFIKIIEAVYYAMMIYQLNKIAIYRKILIPTHEIIAY